MVQAAEQIWHPEVCPSVDYLCSLGSFQFSKPYVYDAFVRKFYKGSVYRLAAIEYIRRNHSVSLKDASKKVLYLISNHGEVGKNAYELAKEHRAS